jgi:Mg-chelatase subunit ChlD
MGLLNPVALVSVVAVGLLWLLYLLRRRTRVPVSNGFLWRSAVAARVAAAPRRVRWNWLLALQTVILLLLVAALARPTLAWLRSTPRRVVLVIDATASMQAREGARTRFELARAEAAAVVNDLRRGDLARLVVLKRAPEVVLDFTDDHGAVRRAIDGILSTDAAGELTEAVDFAATSLPAGQPADIYVFTDRAVRDAAPNVHVISVGRASDNVGITALQARHQALSPHDGELFVEVANFADAPRRARLRITAGRDVLREDTVTLDAGARRAFVQPLAGAAGLLTAEIDIDDDLDADDRAYAIFNADGSIPVLLVSDGHVFLEQALRANPRLDVARMSASVYRAAPPDAPFEVVICDRCGDIETSAPGLLRFHAPSSGGDWRGALAVSDPDHPVTALVSLDDVTVERGVALTAGEGGRVLVRAGREAAVVASDRDGLRTIDVGFDVRASNLPTRVAFPVLVSNMVHWLSQAGRSARTDWRAGEPLRWVLDGARGGAPTREATITDPSGRRVSTPLVNDILSYPGMDRAGPYRVALGDLERTVVANLLSEKESDIRPVGAARSPAAATSPAAAVTSPDPEIWLALVAVAIVLLGIEWIAFRRGALDTPRVRAAFWIRIATALVLVGAAARIDVWRSTGRAPVVFAIDVSDSLTPASRARAVGFVSRSSAGMTATDSLGLVAFGAEAVVERPVGPGRPPAAIGSTPAPGGTNIAAAIRLARAMLKDTGGRIVLASDGRETSGDARAEAAAAAAEGLVIDVLDPGAADAADAQVTSVEAPDRVRAGAPLEVAATIEAGAGARADVRIERDGALVARRTLTWPVAGAERVRLTDIVERPGFAHYRVVVEAPGDPVAGNDEGGAVVHIEGPARVLYLVTDAGAADRAAIRILRAAGFEVTASAPDTAPASAAALSAYDAVVLDNVVAAGLGAAAMSAIASYVEDLGGGLLMTGGADSFGPGGYGNTPVERVLPVEMRPRDRDRTPQLALVLALDKSGSMAARDNGVQKIDLARRAALAVLDHLGPGDELGVIGFDRAAQAIVPLQAASPDGVARSLESLRAGGGTAIAPAIDLARDWLRESRAERKHVLLLSDGRSTPDDAAALDATLRSREFVLSVVGIGADLDRPFLRALADRSGGRTYFPDRLSALADIFKRETILASGQWIVEGSFRPRAGRDHVILRGVDASALPPMSGYVATTPRDAADLLLSSEAGDPVLATWRAGLGRAAGFTSDLTSAWAADLVSSPAFVDLWTRTMRWVSRPIERGVLHPSVSWDEGDGARLAVDARDSDGRFIDFLDVRALVSGPDGGRTDVTLRQSGPGRYEAALDAGRRGPHLASIIARDPSGTREESALAGFYAPAAAEHRAGGPDRARLEDLTRITGGRSVSPGDNPFDHPVARRVPRALWPALVATAMLLLLAEVAVRRGLLRWTR